jgi:hypothetical protein
MSSPRWLVQMSDLPWLGVAGALGLLLEGGLWYAGASSGTPWWVVPARGALAAGGICGWLAFRFGQAPSGMVLGAAAGAVMALLPPLLLPAVGIPFGVVSGGAVAGLVLGWAILPPFTHALVLPLLSIPAIRRLAAHHPLYAHLRDPGVHPAREP